MSMIHLLPVDAYTSREWFDHEQERIFSRTWRYAGFAEDIREPGQFLTVQAGLNNLLIIMGPDRQLRAFHNLCRHRGTQLLRAAGKDQKVITCPYHDWTYDLDGALISVPEEEAFEGLDKSCLGLKPASVACWRSMIFVHPDPPETAGSIVEWFGDIEAKLGPHQPEDLVEATDARAEYEIAANWKIVVENYIDVYHLAHLHSGTLAMYDHAKAEYGFVGPHYAFREPLAADYAADLERNTPYPLVVPIDQAAAYVPMLFPGIGLGESESAWNTFIITPLAPDRTRVETRTRVKNTSAWDFMKQSWRSYSYWNRRVRPKFEGDSKTDPMASGDFSAEDIHACEQLQKSLQSPYFEVGPASRGEGPVLAHQQVVLDFLEREPVVRTRAAPAAPTQQQAKGIAATATLCFGGEEHVVPVAEGQTLLDAAFAAGLNPPHSCQAGVCGTCRSQLLDGSVHMRSRAALTDDEVEAGAILACQSECLSERLRIKFST